MMSNYQLSNAIDSIKIKQSSVSSKYFKDVSNKINIDDSQIKNIQKVNRKKNQNLSYEKSALKLTKQIKSTLESQRSDFNYKNQIIIIIYFVQTNNTIIRF